MDTSDLQLEHVVSRNVNRPKRVRSKGRMEIAFEVAANDVAMARVCVVAIQSIEMHVLTVQASPKETNLLATVL